MKINTKIIVGVLVTTFLLLPNTSVFAVAPYGIEYSGGEPLGENNVQIEPELLSSLTPLYSDRISFSDSDLWEEGYYTYGSSVSPTCSLTPATYFEIGKNKSISAEDNLVFFKEGPDYFVRIQFLDFKIEDPDTILNNDSKIAVKILAPSGTVSVGRLIYDDSECKEQKDNFVGFVNGGRVFVRMKADVYRNGEKEPLKTDELYFNILDIDASQSYKILNENNLLSSDNMYAMSSSQLQPSDLGVESRNMFVENGNYIYSQYLPSGFDITTGGNDIYVKLDKKTQQDGLDLVFGFASAAGSSVSYYARQYKVDYDPDFYGEIGESCIAHEEIISGDNPAGSCIIPDTNYEFDYWTADKPVTLDDGTIIQVGEPLTLEQIKRVVVNGDLVFTAHYVALEESINVPDTGLVTKEDDNATLVSISIIGVLLGSLVVGLLPRFMRKKVSFNE